MVLRMWRSDNIVIAHFTFEKWWKMHYNGLWQWLLSFEKIISVKLLKRKCNCTTRLPSSLHDWDKLDNHKETDQQCATFCKTNDLQC